MLLATLLFAWTGQAVSFAQGVVTKYVRYQQGDTVGYGVLDGTTIHVLNGDFLTGAKPTGATIALSAVRLLPPTKPSKVLAIGLNFASHGSSSGNPPVFAKFPSSVIGHEADIVIPPDAGDLHYEGEMVIIIGKRAKNVPQDQVSDYIFGIAPGNDISERSWQSSDLQWLRSKASDGFGPVGPAVVTGLNYRDILVQTRVNGEIRQSESTKNMIHSVDKIVSWISRYFTLEPGDMIFTGTPGSTRGMQAGDVVEVELKGAGVLRNRLVKTK
ncbi:MAG: fumarylacetoacetate hydrolase family protein [Proteobacteria bacterium]|nr:fumarylacetoacetate hydrolase family protein [Pseudomonadota bacterium]